MFLQKEKETNFYIVSIGVIVRLKTRPIVKGPGQDLTQPPHVLGQGGKAAGRRQLSPRNEHIALARTPLGHKAAETDDHRELEELLEVLDGPVPSFSPCRCTT